jgi:hypothetical protein
MTDLCEDKPFKSAADVCMGRESQQAAFRKRRAAQQCIAGNAPDIPLPALEKSNKLAWALTYLAHRMGPKEPLPTYDGSGQTGIHPMPDTGRVALYGDWAAGTQVAGRIADHIRAAAPEHTIHLGDVYFVGDEDEARENFLGQAVAGSPWRPVAFPPGTQGSFALNGNHEMYARGKGYFRQILPALGQHTSFFALENDHWRVIALDTGYHAITWPLWELLVKPDCHLPDAALAWLKPVLAQTAAKGTILLTHHQPFSFYEAGYPRIAEQIAALLGGPVLWFWGHEHWMSIYAPVTPAGALEVHGRCIGHGGMPCEPPGAQRNAQYPILIEDHRIVNPGEAVSLWPNGYAMLGFDGPDLRIEYRDGEDALVAHESWRVEGGRITATTAPTPDVAGVGPPA